MNQTKFYKQLIFISNFLINQNWFVAFQSLSCVWLFATPWTAARHVSLSFIICQSLPKLMSIDPVMPSNHLVLCHLLLLLSSVFPASGFFLMSQLFASGGQSTRASVSASVLPMSIQDWFPLGLTGLMSLQFKELSRIFSNITVQKHQCPSSDEWIRKPWYIYTMEYNSAIKNNAFELVLMRWMKLEPIIQSEVSQKEKHQHSILTHIYGI